MKQAPLIAKYAALVLMALFCSAGCETPKQQVRANPKLALNPINSRAPFVPAEAESTVCLASHQHQEETPRQLQPLEQRDPEDFIAPHPQSHETLPDLEAFAVASNPTLRRMKHEAGAAWAKTGYVSKLPDPTVSTMFFTPPMNFEPDRQLADLQVVKTKMTFGEQ